MTRAAALLALVGACVNDPPTQEKYFSTTCITGNCDAPQIVQTLPPAVAAANAAALTAWAAAGGVGGGGGGGGGGGHWSGLSAACHALLDAAARQGDCDGVSYCVCSTDSASYKGPNLVPLTDEGKAKSAECGLPDGYVASALSLCFAADCDGAIGIVDPAQQHDNCAQVTLCNKDMICGSPGQVAPGVTPTTCLSEKYAACGAAKGNCSAACPQS